MVKIKSDQSILLEFIQMKERLHSVLKQSNRNNKRQTTKATNTTNTKTL